jgi:two-component system, LytTR family, response regulator
VKIRTVIVDDEPLARERLRALLEGDAEIEIVGECADGRTAVEIISKEAPDLVFLDIQMPELDGFGVLAELQGKRMPAVVFVTAYDRFALKAFEVHALDYLLKPFDRERFEKALSRAKEQVGKQQTQDLGTKISSLLADLKPEAKVGDRLAVKTSGRVIFVKLEEIDWIEAADNYVNIHVGQTSHLLRETMVSLEQRLPTKNFIRISRSAIVNMDRVKELQPLFHGEYAVILRTGARLTLTRGYRESLGRLTGL